MEIIIIALLVVALIVAVAFAAMQHAKLSAAKAEAERLMAEAERLRGDEDRFKALAAQVMADSRRSIADDANDRMKLLLDPLRQNIEAFRRTIDEKYSREATEHGALREKIDELRKLNAQLSEDANTLADALKGKSKVQGDWGEMILENLLRQAGFQEGREYDTQKNIKGENGENLRPDVVVNFPGRGCVVIDSKASLTAYVQLCQEDTEAARKAHVLSVRRHVQELAAKRYNDLIGDRKLDFVMMFIPNEGAYIAAMQLAPELWQEAYDKQVLIISPTHLFSVLKMVQQMWQHDAQTRNAMKIAEEAGKMYDKFVGFVEDMDIIKDAIDRVGAAHENAMKKLRDGKGNLIKRADDLRALGAKASKHLPSQHLEE